MAEKFDYRKQLTDQLVKQIIEGTAPWQKPWDGRSTLPMNPVTGKRYRGGNAVGLWSEGTRRGYTDPRWMTYKQAADQGWQVRAGEKAAWVEYWKFEGFRPKEDDKGNPVVGADGKPVTELVRLSRPYVRLSQVFNAQQIDGIPELDLSQPKHEWDPLERAEKILESSGAVILHDQEDRAFYSTGLDQIHLPLREQFPSAGHYYGTALHELGHWTGHESRLDRKFGRFGDPQYAMEELRAELASLFLAEQLGVPNDPGRHASYVASWVKKLQEDKNEIFRAARDAETITEYVLGLDRDRSLEVEQGQSHRQGRVMIPVKVQKVPQGPQPTVQEDYDLWFKNTANAPDPKRVQSQRGADGRYSLVLSKTKEDVLLGRTFGSAAEARQRITEVAALYKEKVAAAGLDAQYPPQPQRVSNESFSSLLNLPGLPPADWHRGARIESFKLAQPVYGEVTRILAKDSEGQCWSFYGDINMSQADIEEKISEVREAERDALEAEEDRLAVGGR